MNLKDIIAISRKWLVYLAETLDFMANRFDK